MGSCYEEYYKKAVIGLFFFNDTATTEIYTLSLHDALPILRDREGGKWNHAQWYVFGRTQRSEEHTSELQSHSDLVCRLLLEKKNQVFHGEAPARAGID